MKTISLIGRHSFWRIPARAFPSKTIFAQYANFRFKQCGSGIYNNCEVRTVITVDLSKFLSGRATFGWCILKSRIVLLPTHRNSPITFKRLT